MANSAIRKDQTVNTAEYILKTDEPLLPNNTALDTLPASAAAPTDIVMVQKGGLGGVLNGVTAGSIGGTMTWTSVAVPTTLAVDSGYIVSVAGPTDMTLPAVAAAGSIIRIVAPAGGFVVKQTGIAQNIIFNTTTSTPGAGGSVASAANGQAIELLCTVANDDWVVLTSMGAVFTIV